MSAYIEQIFHRKQNLTFKQMFLLKRKENLNFFLLFFGLDIKRRIYLLNSSQGVAFINSLNITIQTISYTFKTFQNEIDIRKKSTGSETNSPECGSESWGWWWLWWCGRSK